MICKHIFLTFWTGKTTQSERLDRSKLGYDANSSTSASGSVLSKFASNPSLHASHAGPSGANRANGTQPQQSQSFRKGAIRAMDDLDDVSAAQTATKSSSSAAATTAAHQTLMSATSMSSLGSFKNLSNDFTMKSMDDIDADLDANSGDARAIGAQSLGPNGNNGAIGSAAKAVGGLKVVTATSATNVTNVASAASAAATDDELSHTRVRRRSNSQTRRRGASHHEPNLSMTDLDFEMTGVGSVGNNNKNNDNNDQNEAEFDNMRSNTARAYGFRMALPTINNTSVYEISPNPNISLHRFVFTFCLFLFFIFFHFVVILVGVYLARIWFGF